VASLLDEDEPDSLAEGDDDGEYTYEEEEEDDDNGVGFALLDE